MTDGPQRQRRAATTIRCRAPRPTGTPCWNQVSREGERCFWHSGAADARKARQKKERKT